MPISEYDGTGGPLFHDVGRLQRDRRCAPSRNPRCADRRREGGWGDRDRTPDVPASGLKASTGAQRGRPRRLYRLEPARLRPLNEWLAKYEQAWNERLDRMDDYLKELQQQGEPQ